MAPLCFSCSECPSSPPLTRKGRRRQLAGYNEQGELHRYCLRSSQLQCAALVAPYREGYQGVSSPRSDCCISSRMRWEGNSWLSRKCNLVSAASAVMSKPEITPARDSALPVA